MTEEFVKEFKRDLIIYSPDYWKSEFESFEDTYSCETLRLEKNIILYSYSQENRLASGIFGNIPNFLRMPVKDILNRANAFVYYNSSC